MRVSLSLRALIIAGLDPTSVISVASLARVQALFGAPSVRILSMRDCTRGLVRSAIHRCPSVYAIGVPCSGPG
jgi:hypothetical protein